MTLGGLALAVGILVDDATVTIENIERHMHLGSDLHKAILEGAGEIAVPALVSTLCICIVFVPMFFLTGVARYLFAPLAEAVVFAMLASYVLSRTLVPTLVMLLMDHAPARHSRQAEPAAARVSRFRRALREDSRRLLDDPLRSAARRRRVRAACSWVFACCPAAWCSFSGRDFFPSVDARPDSPAHAAADRHAHRGNRARGGRGGERHPHDRAGRANWAPILDNLGVPVSGINKSYSNAGTFGSLDGEIQISLNEGSPADASAMWSRCARELPQRFPGRGVLLPAGRHGDADPELRHAVRARRQDHRRRLCASITTLPRSS